MSINNPEARLIANALYEIRLLLNSYLGSENDAPKNVRLAAHIAYALHNEAAALLAGNEFDVKAALQKVAAIDNIVSGSDSCQLASIWNGQNSIDH